MVSHFIQVGYEDYTSEITIQEDDKDCVLIIDDSKTKNRGLLNNCTTTRLYRNSFTRFNKKLKK